MRGPDDKVYDWGITEETGMLYTRRDVAMAALAAGTAGRLLGAKPDSKFGGVQIGVITYISGRYRAARTRF